MTERRVGQLLLAVTGLFAVWIVTVATGAGTLQSAIAAPAALPAILMRTLNAEAGAGGSIAVSPPDSTYEYGTEVSLTATADAGWSFSHWEVSHQAQGWWNNAWNYRFLVEVDANDRSRLDDVAELSINFTTRLAAAGGSGAFDPASLRVVEVEADGSLVGEVAAQFEPSSNYDAATNAAGAVLFALPGTTGPNVVRYFHIYFDVAGKSLPSSNVAAPVSLNPNANDEGMSAYRINTLGGTYYFQDDAGGYSSLLDVDDNDWIDYNPQSGSKGAGEFRGIPNLMPPALGGHFHPGATTVSSSVASSGPVRAVFDSVVRDPDTSALLWRTRWTIYPRCAVLSVLKNSSNYWFLYEGVPGGEIDSSDRVVRSNGTENLLSDSWEGDIANDEWVFFKDGDLGRSLYFYKQGDDTVIDSYRPYVNNNTSALEMTVFGFGRKLTGVQPQYGAVPTQFYLGFVDTISHGDVNATIAGLKRALAITAYETEPRSSNGATSIAANPLALTMTRNYQVQAVFAQEGLTVTTAVAGSGSGSVLVEPEQNVYAPGTMVRLTAQPAPGSRFTGWSGSITSTEPVVEITLTESIDVTATFGEESYQLEVVTEGQGTVSVEPQQSSYRYGDVVKLTPSAGAGYRFAGWTGEDSGAVPLFLTITEDTTITARFARLHKLTTGAEDPAAGTVIVIPDQDEYLDGEIVTVRALPAAGWIFLEWLGDLGGNSNPDTLIMDRDKTVTARFAQLYEVDVVREGEGTVTVSPAPADDGTYLEGALLEFTAVPAPGWRFVGWSGDLTGDINPLEVVAARDMTVIARFAESGFMNYMPLITR